MLVAGDIPGLAPQGQRTLGIDARSWIGGEQVPASEQRAQVHRLEALGFVHAVSERLSAAGETGAEGLSLVILFRSHRSAAANVEHEVRASAAHGARPFAVAGIPGAKGFGGISNGTAGYNVAFPIGPYYYLVGVGYSTEAAAAPTREQLIAAARRLYARVSR